MDKTIRLATKDNQEKVLAILGGDEAAGGGGLVKQMKAAVEEGTSGLAEQVKEAMEKASGGGMIRYQQPTNMLEFYARPKGQGIATAWRDPVDQAFYDRYGLADSIWEKTIIVANQNHMPQNAEDGITYTHTSRNLYRVADGEDVDRGNWYLWNLDPTKKTYFRFFAYGAEGVCNSNPKNAYTYDPNVRGALIFGASKERLREFFRMSKGFGQAVRLGLGLTNEIVEDVNVAEFDRVNTYREFLANQKFVNAATAQGNALEKSAFYSQDISTIIDFYEATPKYIEESTVARVINSELLDAQGVPLKNHFANSEKISEFLMNSAVGIRVLVQNQTYTDQLERKDALLQANAWKIYQTVSSDANWKRVYAGRMSLFKTTEDIFRKTSTSKKLSAFYIMFSNYYAATDDYHFVKYRTGGKVTHRGGSYGSSLYSGACCVLFPGATATNALSNTADCYTQIYEYEPNYRETR